MKQRFLLVLMLVLSICISSCSKYLDAKPNKQLSTLNTQEDLQSLLDLYIYVNYTDPASPEINTDNYYYETANIGYLATQDQNQYTWATSDIYPAPANDWSYIYDNVYRANSVLDNIDKVKFDTIAQQENYNNLKGQALFIRAQSFFEAVNIWTLPYDSMHSQSDLGIPLRLNSDFNVKSTRPSVQADYDQIIQDLKTAAKLLPNTPLHVLRASRPAALALLARVYLSAGDFKSCLAYSDSCLQIKSELLDFNTTDTTSYTPFPLFNTEVIFESGYPFATLLYFGKIDSLLTRTYESGDLRKPDYFLDNGDGTYSYKSGYSISLGYVFDGIATDEIYLMRAECNARLGNAHLAIDDLNLLLSKRYLTGTYTPKSAGTPSETLSTILQERRKELVFRNLRWMDIRRLNRIKPDITITHTLNDKSYQLAPNSKRFATPIPDDIIKLSGMQQNQY